MGLKAVNCQSGDTLAQEQVTAMTKEKVLDKLGWAASKLRGELGESLATVQKFDVPLAQATTSSLEALKAYTLGLKADREKGPAASLPYDQRAIELDPNFAMGYQAMGANYATLDEEGRAREYFSKAFELREHASEPEKLVITANYYSYITGELDKAAQTWQEMIESYPREPASYSDLGLMLAGQGQYEKAAEITRQAMRLAPDRVIWYEQSRQSLPCPATARRSPPDDPRGAGAKTRGLSTPQCPLRSCLSRSRLRCDGGTATVVYGQS